MRLLFGSLPESAAHAWVAQILAQSPGWCETQAATSAGECQQRRPRPKSPLPAFAPDEDGGAPAKPGQVRDQWFRGSAASPCGQVLAVPLQELEKAFAPACDRRRRDFARSSGARVLLACRWPWRRRSEPRRKCALRLRPAKDLLTEPGRVHLLGDRSCPLLVVLAVARSRRPGAGTRSQARVTNRNSRLARASSGRS
jgi:hypothetical protein